MNYFADFDGYVIGERNEEIRREVKKDASGHNFPTKSGLRSQDDGTSPLLAWSK